MDVVATLASTTQPKKQEPKKSKRSKGSKRSKRSKNHPPQPSSPFTECLSLRPSSRGAGSRVHVRVTVDLSTPCCRRDTFEPCPLNPLNPSFERAETVLASIPSYTPQPRDTDTDTTHICRDPRLLRISITITIDTAEPSQASTRSDTLFP